MAEEGKSPSPRRSRASTVWDDTPSGIDRKSLSGMSDSVKAILAPLLGGTKRHSEVKVDLGRDSDSAPYDSVPTGTTPMHRFSNIEHMAAAEAASDTAGTSTSTSGKINQPRASYASQPRSSYAFETLDRSATDAAGNRRTSTDTSVKINQPRASYASEALDRNATEAAGDTGTSTSISAKIDQPRPSYTSRSHYALENLHRSPTEATPSDTETSPDSSAKSSQPRASYVPRRSYVPRTSYRGTESKGKNEINADDSPSRTGSPIDPVYARVEKLMPATKPKIEEYDNYLKEAAPQLRARVSSILADKSHEAGFQRRVPDGMELPELDARPVYGEASDMPQKIGAPSIFDKVKDTVTGQVPGQGIYSGRATLDQTVSNDLLPGAIRDNLPVQDVGVGSNVHSETGGKFAKDTTSEPVKAGSGVPRHMNGPNQDFSKST
ncbi:hypothetical protein KC19_9G061200 [Ceratodon purpureus]|uniref:Uncharacterized protein n=1 Tax=Ceratodon purpureus TaxID=3225 RepID=A0A8T0GQW1_CERPU|nr:hypothetical protein KC19_9G061200 [Ceratodon purpureus]